MRTQQYSRNTDALGRYYTSATVSSLLVEQLPSTKPRAVLDLGSGQGALALAASGRWSRSGLVTVDVDTRAIDLSERLRRKGFLGQHAHFRHDALAPELAGMLSASWAGMPEVAVCNPPFLMKRWRRSYGSILEDVGFSGCLPAIASTDAAVLFLAQNLRMIAPQGCVGIIVPDSLVSAEKYMRFRQELLRRYSPLSADLTSPLSLRVVPTSQYRGEATTPMIGLVLKPETNVAVYGNYSEGLTSTQQVTDRLATNFGEVFAPLKAKQVEFGVKWDFGTWANTLAAYKIERPSLINVFSGARYSADGSGRQRNRGVEWNVFGQVSTQTRVLGGAAYTNGKLTRTSRGVNEGNAAFAAPRWKVNLGGEWDVKSIRGLTLSALAIHTSDQYLNAANTQQLKAWTRLDLGARFTTLVARKTVTFRANIQNATGRQYWDAGFRDGLAVLGAPRTLLLSTSIDL